MKNDWKKLIPACVAGNILELYDFIIYGYFASIIGTLFFPTQDKYSSLLLAFAVFATGSLVRPFSAILLGYLGDKFGRRLSLIVSIGIMTIATLGIGLLPTYAQVGIFAPLMLLLFRICQGLSMTSEEIGAVIFLAENAPEHEKGYASCFVLGTVCVGLFFGSIVSALIFSLFEDQSLMLWGWRIPFILGGMIGLITLLLRIKQPESYEFKQALSHNKASTNPLIELFRQHKLSLLRITLLFSLFSVAIYLFAVYIPNSLFVVLQYKHLTLWVCSFGFLLTFCTSLVVGKLVDRVGTKIPLLISTIGYLLFSYPIFYMLSIQSVIVIILGYSFFAILLGLSAGSIMYATIKAFPVNTRFSGSCIAFNLSMSIFGGTAPLIALYLSTHYQTSPAMLVMMASLLTLCAIVTETQKVKEVKFTQDKRHDYQIDYQNG